MKINHALKILAFWLMLSPAIVHAQEDKLIAIIGNEAVTQSDYDRMKSFLFMLEPAMQSEYTGSSDAEKKKFDDQLFHDFVMKKLVLQQAKAHQVDVEDEEFQNAIQQMAERNNLSSEQLLDQIQKQGADLNYFKQHMKEQVHIEKYFHLALSRQLHVADLDVHDMMQQAHELARYHVIDYWVPVDSDEVKSEHAQPMQMIHDFAKALQSKQGVMPKDQAFQSIESQDLGSRNLAQIPKLYHAVLEKMSQQQVSPVIKAGNGYHVLFLQEKTQITYDEAKNMLLNQKFARKRQEMLDDIESMSFIKDLRWS